MRITGNGSLIGIMTMTHLSQLFDVAGLGQWNLLRRVVLVVVFGIINLLFVLAIWYWLVVSAAQSERVIYLESRAQLNNIEAGNQGLLTKNLALQQMAFYSDVLAGNEGSKPEMSYLLDLMRDQARLTQVLLLHVRPGVTDEHGWLPIDVLAQVSMAALADFWSGLMLQIHDLELRHLELQRVTGTQKYEMVMSIFVKTGSYVDEQLWLRPETPVEGVLETAPDLVRGKHARGFILDKDGKSLVYLMGDNSGRLQRVRSK